MYGEEYFFKGSVAEFVATLTTYSQRVTYRLTPGPYTPSDVVTRIIPAAEEFPADITYAKFKFTSRFTKYWADLIANSLHDGRTLVVMVFPDTSFESDYAKESLEWAWKGIKYYLKGHGWIDDEKVEVAQNRQGHYTQAVRQFVMEWFDDEALTSLCLDYFPDVYQDFTTGMRKSKKVQLLLEYSQRQGRMHELLAVLERERPGKYQEEFSSIPQREAPIKLPEHDIVRNRQRVFISHAHEDSEFAQRLAADLKERGWPVWIAPNSILPGEKWVEAISRGLAESGVFVLVLSKAAVNSRWVQSEADVAIALEHKGEMHFIPLLVESTPVPALWEAYQYISLRSGYEAGLNDLLNRLTPQTPESLDQESRPGVDEQTSGKRQSDYNPYD